MAGRGVPEGQARTESEGHRNEQCQKLPRLHLVHVEHEGCRGEGRVHGLPKEYQVEVLAVAEVS